MKYKYHYIIKRDGYDYDFVGRWCDLKSILDLLIEYYGVREFSRFTFEKKRIDSARWESIYN